jgi:hypothetical protein
VEKSPTNEPRAWHPNVCTGKQFRLKNSQPKVHPFMGIKLELAQNKVRERK